jgi:hypothetical protein
MYKKKINVGLFFFKKRSGSGRVAVANSDSDKVANSGSGTVAGSGSGTVA